MKDYKENGYRFIKSAFTKEWVVQAQKKLDSADKEVNKILKQAKRKFEKNLNLRQDLKVPEMPTNS